MNISTVKKLSQHFAASHCGHCGQLKVYMKRPADLFVKSPAYTRNMLHEAIHLNAEPNAVYKAFNKFLTENFDVSLSAIQMFYTFECIAKDKPFCWAAPYLPEPQQDETFDDTLTTLVNIINRIFKCKYDDAKKLSIWMSVTAASWIQPNWPDEIYAAHMPITYNQDVFYHIVSFLPKFLIGNYDFEALNDEYSSCAEAAHDYPINFLSLRFFNENTAYDLNTFLTKSRTTAYINSKFCRHLRYMSMFALADNEKIVNKLKNGWRYLLLSKDLDVKDNDPDLLRTAWSHAIALALDFNTLIKYVRNFDAERLKTLPAYF